MDKGEAVRQEVARALVEGHEVWLLDPKAGSREDERRDARRARALAGLGALLVVGLAFGLLAILAAWPQEIADLVHLVLYGERQYP